MERLIPEADASHCWEEKRGEGEREEITGERGKDKDHKKESKAQKKERGSMQSSDFVDQSDTKKRQVSKHMKLLVQFPDSYDVKFRFRFNAGHV